MGNTLEGIGVVPPDSSGGAKQPPGNHVVQPSPHPGLSYELRIEPGSRRPAELPTVPETAEVVESRRQSAGQVHTRARVAHKHEDGGRPLTWQQTDSLTSQNDVYVRPDRAEHEWSEALIQLRHTLKEVMRESRRRHSATSPSFCGSPTSEQEAGRHLEGRQQRIKDEADTNMTVVALFLTVSVSAFLNPPINAPMSHAGQETWAMGRWYAWSWAGVVILQLITLAAGVAYKHAGIQLRSEKAIATFVEATQRDFLSRARCYWLTQFSCASTLLPMGVTAVIQYDQAVAVPVVIVIGCTLAAIAWTVRSLYRKERQASSAAGDILQGKTFRMPTSPKSPRNFNTTAS